MIYATVSDVDATLGADWAEEEAKPRAVAMANAYMGTLGLTGFPQDDIPDVVKDAAAEISKAAAAGVLFEQEEVGGVASESVKAGPVSTSTAYTSVKGLHALPSELQYAMALLFPYRRSMGSFSVYR